MLGVQLMQLQVFSQSWQPRGAMWSRDVPCQTMLSLEVREGGDWAGIDANFDVCRLEPGNMSSQLHLPGLRTSRAAMDPGRRATLRVFCLALRLGDAVLRPP